MTHKAALPANLRIAPAPPVSPMEEVPQGRATQPHHVGWGVVRVLVGSCQTQRPGAAPRRVANSLPGLRTFDLPPLASVAPP